MQPLGSGAHLTWSEQGGPRVSSPSRKGFGTMLIRDVPARSLDAEVELRYQLTGLVWSLDVPVDTVFDNVATAVNGGSAGVQPFCSANN